MNDPEPASSAEAQESLKQSDRNLEAVFFKSMSGSTLNEEKEKELAVMKKENEVMKSMP